MRAVALAQVAEVAARGSGSPSSAWVGYSAAVTPTTCCVRRGSWSPSGRSRFETRSRGLAYARSSRPSGLDGPLFLG